MSSLLAKNTFVCSGEIVFELVFGGEYSRDYLVARDERVRLQCDIVFGGD